MQLKKLPKKKYKKRKIKKSLEERRRCLLNEIHRDVFKRLREEHGARAASAEDAGDMSVASLLESVRFQLAGIREEELSKIAEAERKIQNNTYGICEACGGIISEKRLSAIPFAVCCVNCRQKLEKPDSNKMKTG
jgi:DnaK suppressor protein